jgi:hypothetical protein
MMYTKLQQSGEVFRTEEGQGDGAGDREKGTKLYL